MEPAIAAAPAPSAGGASGAPEVSTPQTPAPANPEAAANSQPAAGEGDPEKDEGQEPKVEKEKLPPFHQDPAWQRLQRRSARNERLVREQTLQINQLLEGLKEIKALQKGEEYKPPENVDQMPDLESAFDDELDALSQTHSLSPEIESGVAEIAKKYAYTASDGTKIPLPAEQAYAIYLDLHSSPVTPKPTPAPAAAPAAPKVPASPAENGGVVQRKRLDQVLAEARREIGR